MRFSTSTMKRVIAGVVMLTAFLVMASVFAPDRSSADEFGTIHDPTVGGDVATDTSTDPHQGLRSLGSFESAAYIVTAYSTDSGPRYSVYSHHDRKLVGVLMSADDVTRYFPEVQLRGVKFDVPTNGDVSGPTQFMLVDTPSGIDQP